MSFMRNHLVRPIGSFFYRRSLQRWERLADFGKDTPPETLKELKKHARAIEIRAGAVAKNADRSLISLLPGDAADQRRPRTDWSYRPEPWKCRQHPWGFAPALNNASLGRDVTLYHDCKSRSLTFRQIRNLDPDSLAPFALHLDIFRFRGSFLSIVVRAPDGVTKGLTKNHILGVSCELQIERPVDIMLRLNLRNGPNTEQIEKPVDLSSPRPVT